MKILIAEDSSTVRNMLCKYLREWEYEVEAVTEGRAALDALLRDDHPPTLAILDWMIPEVEGPEICRIMRSHPDTPFSYLILLSARGEKSDVVAGLNAGADDYLVKPFHPAELRSRIRSGERIIELQHKLSASNEELQLLAHTDPVTKHANRASIMERYSEELLRASRQKSALAVVMVDIDHFKIVNDTYGHATGDAVLREFADRLKSQLRVYDAVGRYGGEEFLLLLPSIPLDTIGEALERFQASICGAPICVGDKKISVTASFGAAWFGPNTNPDEEKLLRLADQMLYSAKKNGRDRVEFAAYEGPIEEPITASAPTVG